MSGIESGQVAEIIVELDVEPGRRGSGYRVAPGAVLTAAHVVQDAVSVGAALGPEVAHIDEATEDVAHTVSSRPHQGTRS